MRTASQILGLAALLSYQAGSGPLSAAPRPAPAPAFSDPVALVTWLIGHSSHDFNPVDDAETVNVFSPGLRLAIRDSMRHSREVQAPPCGADGDIILDTQDIGEVRDLHLTAQATAPDRVAVAGSYEVDGYRRNRRYMTVNLGGTWKLENTIEADNSSLRRSLACR